MLVKMESVVIYIRLRKMSVLPLGGFGCLGCMRLCIMHEKGCDA